MDDGEDRRNVFAELAEDAPCGIVVTDPDGRLQYLNQTLKRWLNLPSESGRGPQRLPDLMTLPGRLFYETHMAPMMRLQGFVREISCSLAVAGGDPLPVMLSGVARRDGAGEPVRFDYTIFDARERRVYEDELRAARRKADELAAIVRSSPNAILRVDETGRIRSWNAGAERLLGSMAGSALGVAVHDIVRFDDHPDWFDRAVETCRDAADAVFETVGDHGRHFEVTVALIEGSEPGITASYSVVLRDISERKRAELRLEVAMKEMRHRLKNTLAVVGAIAGQTLPADSRDVFISRLQALARAHDALGTRDEKGADLLDLLAMTAEEAGGAERFRIAGPPVVLAPNQTTSLSMALHELATNALKYGALSVPGGYVEVDIEPLPAGEGVRFVWQERGGPPVAPPAHHGFGSTIIGSLLQYDLPGEVNIEFRREGVRCQVVFDPAARA